MINAILKGIFKIIISLTTLLLSPIDSIITSSLPSLATGLDAVNSLLDYIISVIGFAVDMTGLSSIAISLIVLYFNFILVLPLGVYTVKLALKWYNMLKP